SVVGIGIICAFVGLVLGRSSRFMSRVARLHAAAHGGNAAAKAEGGHADQRVQTVVVVDPQGIPRTADGRYDLDALAATYGSREVTTGQGSVAIEAGDASAETWPEDIAARSEVAS